MRLRALKETEETDIATPHATAAESSARPEWMQQLRARCLEQLLQLITVSNDGLLVWDTD
jgi:hypothetical protein